MLSISKLFIFVVNFAVPSWAAIIGIDDLKQVNATTNFPFRTIGTLGNFCTGALIHPRVVLTSAHCLYDRYSKRSEDDLNFSPGMNQFDAPFGIMGWTSKYFPPEYENLSNSNFLDYDYGIVILNESFVDVCTDRGFENCDQFMELGEEECTDRTLGLSATGYIQGFGASSEREGMWYSICTNVTVNCSSGMQHICDTREGMAGAPLFSVEPQESEEILYTIRGIHQGFIYQQFVNIATTINDELVERINQWISEENL